MDNTLGASSTVQASVSESQIFTLSTDEKTNVSSRLGGADASVRSSEYAAAAQLDVVLPPLPAKAPHPPAHPTKSPPPPAPESPLAALEKAVGRPARGAASQQQAGSERSRHSSSLGAPTAG